MNKIAVIPLRSGNKRLPKKNISLLTQESWVELQEINI